MHTNDGDLMKANKINIIILILGTFLLHSFFGYSQDYLVHTYTENEGLANSKVMDVIQDSTGRMWFATRGGISVYDGSDWKSYTISNGLPVSSYLKIKMDEKGVLWAVPDGKVTVIPYFKNNKWHSDLKIIESLKPVVASSFGITYKNNKPFLSIGTYDKGLVLYHDNKWFYKTTDNGLLSNSVNGVAAWKGQFFIATENGLSVYKDGNVNNSLNEKLFLPSSEIIGISIENENTEEFEELKIWLAGKNWIGYIHNGEFELLSNKISIRLDLAYHNLCMLPDKKGGIYFGNPYQLFHFDHQTKNCNCLGTQNGLLTNGATSLLLDRENNLWISSFHGVSKFVSMRFANYKKSHGLLENEVTAIVEYASGKFVFGHNTGITYFDGCRFEKLKFPILPYCKKFEIRALDIAVDSKKNIWVAASNLGLAKIDQKRRIKWYNEKDGLDGSVTSVLINEKDEIWVANYNGLFKFNDNTFIRVSFDSLPKPYVRKIFQGADNSIYLATNGKGVYYYKNGNWRQYKSDIRKAANDIYSIIIDSRNRILLGGPSGLFTISNDSLISYKLGGKEITIPIYVMVEDTKNRLWLGTDNGVIGWDGENYEEFTVKQGFMGQETNRSAAIVDSRGRVWIGADHGVSCYRENYEYDKKQVPPPFVKISGLDISGDSANFSQTIRLIYYKNNLDFYFKGISFIDERSVNLKYRLDGFDEDWNTHFNTSSAHSRYTNLAPGKYLFRVKAQNALGVWSDEAISEPIIIEQPFWEKWWFYLLGILTIGLIITTPIAIINQKRYSSRLEKQVFERTSQLAQSEQQYRNTINSMGDAIHVVDSDLRVVIFNNSFVKWDKELGLSTEVIGKTIFEIFPFLSENVRDEYQQVFDTGEILITENSLTLNGKEIITEARKIPIVKGDKVVRIVTVIRDITNRKKAEEKIKASLNENVVLLKEIHHRVKNNLQVVSSLLYLQSTKLENAQAQNIINESQNRIRSMAMIHEKLYKSESLAKIDFSVYIKDLTNYLYRTYSVNINNVKLRTDIQNISLKIDSAIPCGLILNELVSNAMKYAFPGERKGEVFIEFINKNDTVVQFNVSDNGVGLPENIQLENSESLGLMLVNTLVDQLKGSIVIERDGGTSFRISFSQKDISQK